MGGSAVGESELGWAAVGGLEFGGGEGVREILEGPTVEGLLMITFVVGGDGEEEEEEEEEEDD